MAIAAGVMKPFLSGISMWARRSLSARPSLLVVCAEADVPGAGSGKRWRQHMTTASEVESPSGAPAVELLAGVAEPAATAKPKRKRTAKPAKKVFRPINLWLEEDVDQYAGDNNGETPNALWLSDCITSWYEDLDDATRESYVPAAKATGWKPKEQGNIKAYSKFHQGMWAIVREEVEASGKEFENPTEKNYAITAEIAKKWADVKATS